MKLWIRGRELAEIDADFHYTVSQGADCVLDSSTNVFEVSEDVRSRKRLQDFLKKPAEMITNSIGGSTWLMMVQ
jgi:hypothetical protein